MNNRTCSRQSLPQLLALVQHAAPLLERLVLSFEPSEENMLPDVMIADSSKLEVFILEGCHMSWELACFRNLKIFSLCRIPAGLGPSMIQLLGILSKMPLLEMVKITDISDSTSEEGVSSLQSVVPISFVHLKHINLSCDLRSSSLFFDNVILSRDTSQIELEYTVSPPLVRLDDSSIAFMKRIARKVQNNIPDSFTQLILMGKIHCSMFSSDGSETATTVDIDLSKQRDFNTVLGNAFWQSLHLDQLQFLRVDYYWLDANAWMLLGDLPLLTKLQVRSNERPLLEVLYSGMVAQPVTPGRSPTFRMLKRLTTFGWPLHKRGSVPGETIAMQMVTCFRSRKAAGLHLEELTLVMEGFGMKEPREVDQETLAELRKWITKVDADSVQQILGYRYS
ncbi:hypothetical protein C0995_013630 [Termitomyces sp. Mi166|nr:hypothetical protein C0995_013630 [Termitomyces sp. Mi166\